MTASSTTGTYGSAERRHPRLVRRTAWLRRHSVAVGVACAVLIAVIFFLDAGVHPVTMAGFYLVPLTLLALAAHERLVAAAGIICGLLTVLVMVVAGHADGELPLQSVLRRPRRRQPHHPRLSHPPPVDDQRLRHPARPALRGRRGHPHQWRHARRPRRTAPVRPRASRRAARRHRRRASAPRGRLLAGTRRVRPRRRRPRDRRGVRRHGAVRRSHAHGDDRGARPDRRRPFARSARRAPAPRARAGRAHARPRPRGRRARVQPRAGERRLRSRAGEPGGVGRPLPGRRRRQRASHARARRQASRPRAGARLEPRLRPEPGHDRSARSRRHAAARRPRHARLRRVRGGSGRGRAARPRQLRRPGVRRRGMDRAANWRSITSPPARWPSPAAGPYS